MTRREARNHLFVLLFQNEFGVPENVDEVLSDYMDSLEEESELDRKDKQWQFIKEEYRGILAKRSEIDSKLAKYSKWQLSRLSKTDLTILRLGAYEVLFEDGIPDKVAVNEAVELAKAYSAEKSPGFINGMLGSVMRGKNQSDEVLHGIADQ